jgi:hypothetical protein
MTVIAAEVVMFVVTLKALQGSIMPFEKTMLVASAAA